MSMVWVCTVSGVTMSFDKACETRASADLRLRFGGLSQRKWETPSIDSLASTPDFLQLRRFLTARKLCRSKMESFKVSHLPTWARSKHHWLHSRFLNRHIRCRKGLCMWSHWSWSMLILNVLSYHCWYEWFPAGMLWELYCGFTSYLHEGVGECKRLSVGCLS